MNREARVQTRPHARAPRARKHVPARGHRLARGGADLCESPANRAIDTRGPPIDTRGPRTGRSGAGPARGGVDLCESPAGRAGDARPARGSCSGRAGARGGPTCASPPRLARGPCAGSVRAGPATRTRACAGGVREGPATRMRAVAGPSFILRRATKGRSPVHCEKSGAWQRSSPRAPRCVAGAI